MALFERTIADRYLKTHHKGAFVRIMVRFARGGTALGVFAMVVTLAVMNGFREEIQATLFSGTAHFTVFHLAGDIPDTQGTLQAIRAVPGVKAASPIRLEKGLLRRTDSEMPPEAVVVKAVDPASAHGTSSIFDTQQPTPIEQLKEGEIVLGKELAQRLGLRIGDTVALVFFRMELGLGGQQPKVAAFKVAATFHSHSSEYDKAWAIIHLGDAMRLARTEGRAEMIEVRAKSIDAIAEVKPRVLEALGPAYQATDLRDSNKSLFAALTVEKWAFAAILSLIVLVAAFNIVASLVLLVTEKRRDLGVLLALGATPRQIQRLFELQGLRIGAVGTAWGLGTSVPLCLILDHFKLLKLPAAVYDFITYMPFRLKLLDIVLVGLFPLLVSWLAARYPAKKAASLDPVDALRAE
ncbi:ABC transporter permease [Geothrix sp. PMB-07]|uniref:ABC transporter permease n=1 Tax=Geothrix sp. PMB-07 TaxID=3068640 RepID=UPI002741BA41|nr:ABC transporter permease [Geothrix sp. PMB-07]WLT31239.1 ABC transporter permease [Geothrix sp. PMB-07]